MVSLEPTWVDGRTAEDVGPLQVVVYTMCGGGYLGRLAAEQPADFYIDGRVGKLPYGRKAILRSVAALAALAIHLALDPHNMPKLPMLWGAQFSA